MWGNSNTRSDLHLTTGTYKLCVSILIVRVFGSVMLATLTIIHKEVIIIDFNLV